MKRGGRPWAWTRRNWPRLVVVSWLVAAGALQTWQFLGETSTDVALTMVLVAAGAWLLLDRRALDRIGGFSALGFEVKLQVPDYTPGVDRETSERPERSGSSSRDACRGEGSPGNRIRPVIAGL